MSENLVEAFWNRIQTETCPAGDGGRHELVNEDATAEDDGPWFTTCRNCWVNFDQQLERELAAARDRAKEGSDVG